MPLSKDLREFVECLNFNKVEFLVVGALAVSWHGFPRYSADIDFFLRASHANAERVLRAIRQFGFGSLDITVNDLVTPGRVIQLGREPNRIDLLTSISGVGFEDAWSSRVDGDIDGLPVAFIGLDALLRNKASTGRPKDRIDLEYLQKHKP
jgi:predicted nucleotidyltransferase